MVLANRTKLANSRSLVRVFGGLNETYACSEAEYSAGVNFSARDFPALSTRKPRRKLHALTGLNGMYHLNGLLTICGKDIIYTPDAAGADTQHPAQTLFQLPCRLVGKGDCHYVPTAHRVLAQHPIQPAGHGSACHNGVAQSLHIILGGRAWRLSGAVG